MTYYIRTYQSNNDCDIWKIAEWNGVEVHYFHATYENLQEATEEVKNLKNGR